MLAPFGQMNPLLKIAGRGALAVTVSLSLAAGAAPAVEESAKKPEATAAKKAKAKEKDSAKAGKRMERTVIPTELHTPPSISPKSTAKPELKATAARIDELIESKLAAEKMQPNATVTDEVFVRRIYLDVIGRVPTKAETLAFLESKETNKRGKLIDKLLSDPSALARN